MDEYELINRSGRDVLLLETGHLSRVVAEYQQQVEERLLGQIADRSRSFAGRQFRFKVDKSYEMQHIVYDLGKTRITGWIEGKSQIYREYPSVLFINGTILFELEDAFTDPYDTLNLIDGKWDPYGTPYKISDTWQGTFSGRMNMSRHKSRYKYNAPSNFGDTFP